MRRLARHRPRSGRPRLARRSTMCRQSMSAARLAPQWDSLGRSLPVQVDPNATPAPNAMPTPNLDATMARLRAQAGAGGSPPASAPTPPRRSASEDAQQPAAAPGPPQRTGFLANIGAGTGEATTGLLGLPWIWPPAPSTSASVGLTRARVPLVLAKSVPGGSVTGAPPPGLIPEIQNPVGGSQWWNPPPA